MKRVGGSKAVKSNMLRDLSLNAPKKKTLFYHIFLQNQTILTYEHHRRTSRGLEVVVEQSSQNPQIKGQKNLQNPTLISMSIHIFENSHKHKNEKILKH